MLYDPCFKNVIKTEDCSLKEWLKQTDFVWRFFTDEWKLFRSHFVLGFMERCFSYMKNYLQKKARRLHTLESRATKPYLENIRFNKSLSKAYVKTAHAVYESTNFF